MSEDDLLKIFHSELKEDIPVFGNYLKDADQDAIRAFAHKYKIRLHYLGFSTCYELCLAIERYRNEEDLKGLIDAASKLHECLLDIPKK